MPWTTTSLIQNPSQTKTADGKKLEQKLPTLPIPLASDRDAAKDLVDCDSGSSGDRDETQEESAYNVG